MEFIEPTEPWRALVIEDDQVSGSFLSEVLREQGFAVEHVEDADEAMVKLLGGRTPELLVVDLVLPGTSGLDVLRAARNLLRQPASIAVTALGSDEPLVRETESLGIPVLFKPVDPATLAQRVSWTMHDRRTAAETLGRDYLEALFKVATAANELDARSETALQRVLSVLSATLGGDSASIMLFEDEGPRTKVFARVGPQFAPGDSSGPLGEISSWIARERRPLFVRGKASAYPQFSGLPDRPDVAESLLIPLTRGHQPIGALSVSSAARGRLPEDGLGFLAIAGHLVSSLLERLRQAQHRAAQERLAIIGQMAAEVVHEINSPLAFSSAGAQDLSRQLKDVGARFPELRPHLREALEVVGEVQEGLDRISKIAGSLRSFSRSSGGSTQPTMTEVDVQKLIERAVSFTRYQVRYKAEVVVEPSEVPPVVGDGDRLLQVLVNLLVNAGHAMPGFGRISVRAGTQGDVTWIEVEDNGRGMSAATQAQLMRPFFTTKPDGQGTGLGLFVSQQIVREHHGRLTFVSEEGKGTRFRIMLPTRGARPRKLLLLVDDDPNTLSILSEQLTGRYEVITADSVGAAREALKAAPWFDCVVTDLRLGDGSGLELANEVSRLGSRPPVVVVTAFGENDAQVRSALTLRQVKAVVRKPWSGSRLNELIDSLTGAGPQA